MAETNGYSPPIEFCTLGMFIIDDIYPSPTSDDPKPRTNIIGGAGTYSALGARLLSPPPASTSIGWIVDAGTDFPSSIQSQLLSWKTDLLLRSRNAPTTRGWNGYTSNDRRQFKYLTERKRLTPADLPPHLLQAKSFHLICSPERCIEMTTLLKQLRHNSSASSSSANRPIIIWEPLPDTCLPSELPNHYKALQYVDFISPNHAELASLFNFTHPSNNVDRAAVERQTNNLLAHGIGPTNGGSVVVRAGREGCFVANLNRRRWLPAYHQNASRVIDPTGGGTGF